MGDNQSRYADGYSGNQQQRPKFLAAAKEHLAVSVCGIGVVLVGGTIQDVSGIPDGVAVHVYNYDCGLGPDEHFVETWEN